MGKQLAKLLKADIQDSSDLKSIAKMLAGKGRGKDTILAHITPREAEVLKEAGGSGTTNPETGLLEFEGGFEGGVEPDTAFEGSITQPSYDYQAPLNAAESSFAVNYDTPAQELTPSGIDPVYYQMQQQYGGMADIPQSAQSAAIRGPGDSYMANQALYGTRPGESALMQQTGESPKAKTAGEDKPFLSNEQMVRLGLAGGLGVYGAMQQKKAGEQNKKAMEEQQALARPYQAQGKQLTEAAQRGELTAAGQQQLQGLQAQLAQGAESRGGVGAAQAAAQAQAFRNQLLQNQYDYGLKVSQIGDNIALGAIRTGMQLDQQLNQANMAFYTQLGSLAAGIPTYQTVRSS